MQAPEVTVAVFGLLLLLTRSVDHIGGAMLPKNHLDSGLVGIGSMS